jgi:hypothetical protein
MICHGTVLQPRVGQHLPKWACAGCGMPIANDWFMLSGVQCVLCMWQGHVTRTAVCLVLTDSGNIISESVLAAPQITLLYLSTCQLICVLVYGTGMLWIGRCWQWHKAGVMVKLIQCLNVAAAAPSGGQA